MKKIYFLFSMVLITSFSYGQLSLYEDFNYTVGQNVGGNATTTSDAVGANNWATHSNTATTGTGTIDVLSGNLSYAGLAASSGNKVLMPGANATTPRDINRVFTTPTTATTLYYSFLINVVDNTQLVAAISGTNNYFIALGATSGASVTSLNGRVAITSSNSGANYRLSISNTSTGTLTYTENPVDLNFGTTYLVVVKYDRSAAPTVATLWVNPSSLGGAEPASTLTNSSGTGTVTAFASIVLRNSSSTPKAEIDEIRVGETWASVTPTSASVSDITSFDKKVQFSNTIVSEQFTVILEGKANVEIFNTNGQLIKVLAGSDEINVNTSSLAKGTYLVRVSQDGNSMTKKIIVK